MRRFVLILALALLATATPSAHAGGSHSAGGLNDSGRFHAGTFYCGFQRARVWEYNEHQPHSQGWAYSRKDGIDHGQPDDCAIGDGHAYTSGTHRLGNNVDLFKWNGSSWYRCVDRTWHYNASSTSTHATGWTNRWPCGAGYYFTRTWQKVWFPDVGWKTSPSLSTHWEYVD